MKKIFKSLLSILLVFGLFGCENDVGNIENQEKFDMFIDELVKDEVSSDFLSYHYLLVDGESFGVEKPEVSLGSLSLDSSLEAIEETKQVLNELHEFKIKELTPSQQNIYELLEIRLQENIEYEKYLNFDYCFGDNLVNDNLITNFTEYRISNKEDVEDFIQLLNDSDRYIQEGIERTQELANDGYIQNELIKDSIVESCEKFIKSEEIEKYFSSTLKEIDDIADEDKIEYEKEVSQAVNEVMQPAYQKIIDLFKELPKSKYQGSLSEIENGKDYYEYLLKTKVGSFRDAEEWIEILEEEMVDTITSWVTIMFMNDNIEEEIENVNLGYDNAVEMVKALEKSIDEEFPKIDQVKYRVSYLDASVANELTSAYYVIPPIDATNQNVIKVNPNQTDLVSLYSTLAHEGFPGHLYQNNYAIQNKQPVIYRLLDYSGSSEGWAEYVGMNAYRIGNIGSDSYQEYMRYYDYLNRILVQYVDLRVHYSNWAVEDISDYLDEIGLINDIAQSLYETAVQYPAIYAPYSLGVYEVFRLREMAEKELGNKFKAIEFNQAYLDAGTVHFSSIEKAIQQYIDEK